MNSMINLQTRKEMKPYTLSYGKVYPINYSDNPTRVYKNISDMILDTAVYFGFDQQEPVFDESLKKRDVTPSSLQERYIFGNISLDDRVELFELRHNSHTIMPFYLRNNREGTYIDLGISVNRAQDTLT
ncbi:MAG: hypothetical protein ACMXYA_00550 [Candidatus Woesearchaeota archaeon]